MRMFGAMLSIGAMILIACSAVSERDGRTVTAGPMLCLATNDDGLTVSPMSVTCDVTVGNTEVSTEGIDVSVTNILQVKVLPDLCPAYRRSEILADSKGFAEDLRTALSQQYAAANSGWTVASANCMIADY
jgi:hypothetical protein